ncbi:hypothetical protein CRM22_008550, partial [Opisthorchis felineus]
MMTFSLKLIMFYVDLVLGATVHLPQELQALHTGIGSNAPSGSQKPCTPYCIIILGHLPAALDEGRLP